MFMNGYCGSACSLRGNMVSGTRYILVSCDCMFADEDQNTIFTLVLSCDVHEWLLW